MIQKDKSQKNVVYVIVVDEVLETVLFVRKVYFYWLQ